MSVHQRKAELGDSQTQLLLAALKAAAGPALVLDERLRIIAGTDGIEKLLGGPLPLLKPAPQVLCGQSTQRPIAEALAKGEPASAEISQPSADGEELISIRTAPLKKGGSLIGHLLLLVPLGNKETGVSELHGILTASECMRALLRRVKRVAASEASVLVRGETGTGKELIARAIHDLSPRKDKTFAAINCAALPPQLAESELFGHVRGAFTSAVRDVKGIFRHADGGTLFLDEVAELPLEIQAKLLRVTQERTVIPVGGSTPIPVNVRIVSATHRSLRNEVKEGRFREDLMYRLRVVPLFLPSLKERSRDIEPLAQRFVDILNERSSNRKVASIAPGALEYLKDYSWPGNIRELQNVIEYAFLLGDGPRLSEGDLPDELLGKDPLDRERLSDKEHSEKCSQEQLPPQAQKIARALERASGNRSRAAASLGISRSTLWRKMKKYGVVDSSP